MGLLLWMNMAPSLALVVDWLDESTLGGGGCLGEMPREAAWVGCLGGQGPCALPPAAGCPVQRARLRQLLAHCVVGRHGCLLLVVMLGVRRQQVMRS